MATTAAPTANPVDTAGRLRLLITRLARAMRQQDGGDLTPTLRAALATIDREGPLTLGDLAKREHVAPPSITRAVDRLEAMGLVRRRQDADDRRVARAHVTAAGHRQVAQNRSRRNAWLATRLADLSDDDLRRLADAAAVLERLLEPPEPRKA